MKRKPKAIEAMVVFPVYLKLDPKELKDKTAAEVKERILELAGEVLDDNVIDMRGFITQCTRKPFIMKVPKIKKTGFRYSAKDALECGTSIELDDDTEGGDDITRVGKTKLNPDDVNWGWV